MAYKKRINLIPDENFVPKPEQDIKGYDQGNMASPFLGQGQAMNPLIQEEEHRRALSYQATDYDNYSPSYDLEGVSTPSPLYTGTEEMPRDLFMSDWERAGRSFTAGVGNVVGQIGDIWSLAATVIPGYGFSTKDVIGNTLRKWGGSIKEEYESKYVDPMLEKLTWEQILSGDVPEDVDVLKNVNFYTTMIMEQLPNLLTMLIPGYKGASMARKSLLKHATKWTKKGVLGTPRVMTKAGLTYSSGKGLLGGILKKTGKVGVAGADDIYRLTKLGAAGASAIGGGALRNVVDGMMVAGDAYRTALESEDFDRESAGNIARGVLWDNFKWLGVDMLSWGITFGGLSATAASQVFKRSAFSGVKAFSNKAFSVIPKNSQANLFKSVSNVVRKGAFEGVEEMFQETYQDWMVKKRKANEAGKIFEYEGFWSGGYWEYLNSPENQATRLISLVTGAIGGSVGGIVGNIAERQSKLDSQEEIFKKISGNESVNTTNRRLTAINDIVTDAVVNNNLEEMKTFILDGFKAGKITEESKNLYLQVAEEYEKLYKERVPGFMKEVTELGSKTYFKNVLQIESIKNGIEALKEKNRLEKEKTKDNPNKDAIHSQLDNEFAAAEKEAMEAIEALEKQNQSFEYEAAKIRKQDIKPKVVEKKEEISPTQVKWTYEETKPEEMTQEEKAKYFKKYEKEKEEKEIAETERLSKIELSKEDITKALKESKTKEGIKNKSDIVAHIANKIRDNKELTENEQTLKKLLESEINEFEKARKPKEEEKKEGVISKVITGVKEAFKGKKKVEEEEIKEEVKEELTQDQQDKKRYYELTNKATLSRAEKKEYTKLKSKFSKQAREQKEDRGGYFEKIYQEGKKLSEKTIDKKEEAPVVKEEVKEKPKKKKILSKKEEVQVSKLKEEINKILSTEVFTVDSRKQLNKLLKRIENITGEEAIAIRELMQEKDILPGKTFYKENRERWNKYRNDMRDSEISSKEIDKVKNNQKKEKAPDQETNIKQRNISTIKELDMRIHNIVMSNFLNSKLNNEVIIALDDTINRIGAREAFKIGGAMFVNTNEYFQTGFIHEYSHIWFEVFKDSPIVKAFKKEVFKKGSELNKLYKEISETYPDMKQYNFKGKSMVLAEVLHTIWQDEVILEEIFGDLNSYQALKNQINELKKTEENLNSKERAIRYNEIQSSLNKFSSDVIQRSKDDKNKSLSDFAAAPEDIKNQHALIEETFSTYIANPNDLGQLRPIAQAIYNSFFQNPDNIKKRNSVAKRFWNNVAKFGNKLSGRNVNILKTNPDLANLESLDDIEKALIENFDNENSPEALKRSWNKKNTWMKPILKRMSDIDDHSKFVIRMEKQIEELKVSDKTNINTLNAEITSWLKNIITSFTNDSKKNLLSTYFKDNGELTDKGIVLRDFLRSKYEVKKSKYVSDLVKKMGISDFIDRFVTSREEADKESEAMGDQNALDLIINTANVYSEAFDILNEFVSRSFNQHGDLFEGHYNPDYYDNMKNHYQDRVNFTLSKMIKKFLSDYYSQKKGESNISLATEAVIKQGSELENRLLTLAQNYKFDFIGFVTALENEETVETTEFIRWLKKNLKDYKGHSSHLYNIYRSIFTEYSGKGIENIFNTIIDVNEQTGSIDLFDDKIISMEEERVIKKVLDRAKIRLQDTRLDKKRLRDLIVKTKEGEELRRYLAGVDFETGTQEIRKNKINKINNLLKSGGFGFTFSRLKSKMIKSQPLEIDKENKVNAIVKILEELYGEPESRAEGSISKTLGKEMKFLINETFSEGRDLIAWFEDVVGKDGKNFIKRRKLTQGEVDIINVDIFKEALKKAVLRQRTHRFITLVNNAEGNLTNIVNKNNFLINKINHYNNKYGIDKSRYLSDQYIKEHHRNLKQNGFYNEVSLDLGISLNQIKEQLKRAEVEPDEIKRVINTIKNMNSLINKINKEEQNIYKVKETEQQEVLENIYSLQDEYKKLAESIKDYTDHVSPNQSTDIKNIFYQELENGNNLNLSMRGGLFSLFSDKGINYIRLSPEELEVADMDNFYDSFNDLRTTHFKIGIAVFAEKPRRYYIDAPIARTEKEFLEKHGAYLKHHVNLVYKNGSRVLKDLIDSNGNINYDRLNNEIFSLEERIAKNPSLYGNNENFKKFLKKNKEGIWELKKSRKGVPLIRESLRMYVLNTAANRFQAQRLFIGDHSKFENETNYTKRAAGAIARHVPFDNSSIIDPIIFQDVWRNLEDGTIMSEQELIKNYGKEALNQPEKWTKMTDSSSFILPEDHQMVKDHVGELFDVGNHYKFVGYGSDNRGKGDRLLNSIGSSATYFKTNTFILTDDMASKSEYLANLRNLMKERKKQLQGENNMGNILTFAIAESGVKSFGINTSEVAIDIKNPIDIKKLNLDKDGKNIFYHRGKFKGLPGENFGIQNKLDRSAREGSKIQSVFPTQAISGININYQNYSKEVQKIIDQININLAEAMVANAKQKTFLNGISMISPNSLSQINQIDDNIFSRILPSWFGEALLNMGEYTNKKFPKLNAIKSAMANKYIQDNSTKLITPGTIGYQTTDVGMNLQEYTSIDSLIKSIPDTMETEEYIESLKETQNKYGDIIVSEIIVPNYMKDQLGYKQGNVLLGSRIPGHGKSTQVVFVIKDFFEYESGSSVSVSSKVSAMMGSDLDGDAIFLNGLAKKQISKSDQHWNDAFDNIVRLLGNAETVSETQKQLIFQETINEAVEKTKEAYQDSKQTILKIKETSMLFPTGDNDIFRQNSDSKNNIGIIADLHRNLNMLSRYNIPFKHQININNNIQNNFNDDNGDNWFVVAQLLNIILDNPKHLLADKLGLNKATIKGFAILSRLGYNLGDISIIYNNNISQKFAEYSYKKTLIERLDTTNIPAATKVMIELIYKRSEKQDLIKRFGSFDAWWNTLDKSNKQSYIRKAKSLLKIDKGGINIDLENIKQFNIEEQIELLKLINYLDQLGSDVFNAGRAIGVYNVRVFNGHQAEEIKNKIENLGNEESMFKESDELNAFKNNPIIKHNIKTLDSIMKHNSSVNINYSDRTRDIQEYLNNVIWKQNLFANDQKALAAIESFIIRNNISILKDLKIDKNTEIRLYNKIQNYVDKNIESIITELGIEQVPKNIKNIGYKFFKYVNHGINPEGKPYLYMNPNINQNTPVDTINDIKQYFRRLPKEIQEAIVQLDFVQNQWHGSMYGSTMLLWPEEIFTGEFTETLPNGEKIIWKSKLGKGINTELDTVLKISRTSSQETGNKIGYEFLKENPEYSHIIPYNKIEVTRDGFYKVNHEWKNDVYLLEKNENKIPFIIQSFSEKENVWKVFEYNFDKKLYEIIGEFSKEKKERIEKLSYKQLVKNKKQRDLNVERDHASASELLSRKDKPYNNYRVDMRNFSDVNGFTEINRNFGHPGVYNETLKEYRALTSSEWYTKNGFDENVLNKQTEAIKHKINKKYFEYQKDYQIAARFYDEFIKNENYRKKSNSWLEQQVAILYRLDNSASESVIPYLIVELSERTTGEQLSSIQKIAKNNNIDLTQKDESVIGAWFRTVNLSQHNADVQAIQNMYEKEYRKFNQSIDPLSRKMDDVYRLLLKSKIKELGWVKYMRTSESEIFKNFIVTEEREDIGDTQRLKSDTEIKEDLAANRISQEEYNYITTFKNSIKEVAPEMLTEQGADMFLPHVVMGNYEAYSKRGLLGLFATSVLNEQKIDDIKVYGTNFEGVKKLLSLKEWKVIYLTASKKGGLKLRDGKRIYELDKLRRKARKFLKQGKNEDGSRIDFHKIDKQALFGSNIFKHFSNGGKILNSEFGTTNLNKIFKHWIHAKYWKDGDYSKYNDWLKWTKKSKNNTLDYKEWRAEYHPDSFQGMEALLPYIDGAMKINEMRGNTNILKYLKTVVKQGSIGNRKQEGPISIPGVISANKVDRIINSLVKLTAYIVLGLHPKIAIGNLMIGKYQEFRSKGGKHMIRGEKRYWDFRNRFQKSSRVPGLRPFTTVNWEIVNQIFKLEHYQWDNVTALHKRSTFSKILFAFMDKSEHWIQGASFLGMMTKEQLNAYTLDNNGKLIVKPGEENNALTSKQISEMTQKVKKEQGFGYSPIDQRMLQMYSWGRAVIQFKRWFPTLVRERFGEEFINRHGQAEIGSYTATFSFVKKWMSGELTAADYKKLPAHRKESIQKYLRGLYVVIPLLALSAIKADDDEPDDVVDRQLKRLTRDVLAPIDPKRYKWMPKPSLTTTTKDILEVVANTERGRKRELMDILPATKGKIGSWIK